MPIPEKEYSVWCAGAIGSTKQPKHSPDQIWRELMEEAKACKRTWGMGFPVISTCLLRKYWQKATGWLPPEGD